MASPLSLRRGGGGEVIEINKLNIIRPVTTAFGQQKPDLRQKKKNEKRPGDF